MSAGRRLMMDFVGSHLTPGMRRDRREVDLFPPEWQVGVRLLQFNCLEK